MSDDAFRLWPPFDKPAGCGGCPLAKAGRGFVPGFGRRDARLVGLGEAPGQQEVLAGEPFVGPSGKVIRRGTEGVATFWTNVRKCLPPKGEDEATRRASIDHCVRTYLQPEADALTESREWHAVGADAEEVLVGIGWIMDSHGSFWRADEAEAQRAAAERERGGKSAALGPDAPADLGALHMREG